MHAHDHHDHEHARLEADRRALSIALALLLALMVGEIAAGLAAGSLALLADAGHMLTDAGALGFALFAAALATGWDRFDPLAGLAVAALMLWASVGLLRASGRIFLEMSPGDIDPDEVLAAVRAADEVVDVHDLHVWTVTSGFPALSAHVLVP